MDTLYIKMPYRSGNVTVKSTFLYTDALLTYEEVMKAFLSTDALTANVVV